jgi:hypothetical protein
VDILVIFGIPNKHYMTQPGKMLNVKKWTFKGLSKKVNPIKHIKKIAITFWGYVASAVVGFAICLCITKYYCRNDRKIVYTGEVSDCSGNRKVPKDYTIFVRSGNDSCNAKEGVFTLTTTFSLARKNSFFCEDCKDENLEGILPILIQDNETGIVCADTLKLPDYYFRKDTLKGIILSYCIKTPFE